MASTDNTFRVPNDLGEFLLCTWGCSGISHVKIMMRLPHKKEGVPFNYVQIGKGDLWDQDWKIQDDAIVKTEHNIKYLPLNGASLSSKFVYLAFMDNSDMECCDARYNKGSHASTYFCVYCLINRPEIYFGDDIPYRTPQSLSAAIQSYDEASTGQVKLPSGTSALQYSKGIKGFAPDPFPGSSRIVPALMHIHMGIVSRVADLDRDFVTNIASESYFDSLRESLRLQMEPIYKQLQHLKSREEHWGRLNNEYYLARHHRSISLQHIQQSLQKVQSERRALSAKYSKLYSVYKSVQRDQQKFRGNNALSVYEQKLKQYKIERTRYYKSLEGRPCRKYVANWKDIMAHCSSSMYMDRMQAFIEVLDSLVKIIGQSKPTLTLEECQKAEQILVKVDEKWKALKDCVYVDQEMPPKYHYLGECVKFACFWRMPLGYCNEQSVEAYHQILNRLRRSYLNQRGVLRVKYMMDKLLMITSPKLCDKYAHAVDDKT